MSKAFKCDMCLRYRDGYPEMTVSTQELNEALFRKKLHLCRECSGKIMAFIRRGGDDGHDEG